MCKFTIEDCAIATVANATNNVENIGIEFKKNFIEKFNEKTYLTLFSILILLSLGLIILGWRSTTSTYLYTLPAGIKPVALLLMLIAFLLFGAAKHQTRIKKVVRHPQLTSVIVWSCAHLLLNGDSRSLILFGWLGVWAVLEIILINKREGEWKKADSPNWGQEAKGVLISLIIFAVVAFAHPFIAGVPIR